MFFTKKKSDIVIKSHTIFYVSISKIKLMKKD